MSTTYKDNLLEAEYSPPELKLVHSPKEDPKRPWYADVTHTLKLPYTEPIKTTPEFRTDLTSYPSWIKPLLLWVWPFVYVYQYGFAITYDPFPWLSLVGALALVVADPYGRHQRAAFWHDFLCTLQGMSRVTADAIYKRIMEDDGVAKWRVWSHYLAVRLFGWIHSYFNRTSSGRKVEQCSNDS